MAIFDPCSSAPQSRMTMHSCEISDEVNDIARGAVCNKATLPVAFIEANGRMVKI